MPMQPGLGGWCGVRKAVTCFLLLWPTTGSQILHYPGRWFSGSKWHRFPHRCTGPSPGNCTPLHKQTAKLLLAFLQELVGPGHLQHRGSATASRREGSSPPLNSPGQAKWQDMDPGQGVRGIPHPTGKLVLLLKSCLLLCSQPETICPHLCSSRAASL